MLAKELKASLTRKPYLALTSICATPISSANFSPSLLDTYRVTKSHLLARMIFEIPSELWESISDTQFFTFSNGNIYHTDFNRVKQASDSMAAGIEKGTFSNFFDCHHDMWNQCKKSSNNYSHHATTTVSLTIEAKPNPPIFSPSFSFIHSKFSWMFLNPNGFFQFES